MELGACKYLRCTDFLMPSKNCMVVHLTDDPILGFYTIYCALFVPIFQGNVLPPS
jgi:hypothetical protein